MSAADFSYDDLGQSDATEMYLPQESRADLVPYLEAVGRIAELRRSGQIGPSYTTPTTTARLSYPGAITGSAVVSPSSALLAADPKMRGTPLTTVLSSTTSQRPTTQELDVPQTAAERAAAIDAEYKAAKSAYDAAQADIRRKQDDPEFPRSQFPELAKQQRERLQRVADLAAARREYGLTD